MSTETKQCKSCKGEFPESGFYPKHWPKRSGTKECKKCILSNVILAQQKDDENVCGYADPDGFWKHSVRISVPMYGEGSEVTIAYRDGPSNAPFTGDDGEIDLWTTKTVHVDLLEPIIWDNIGSKHTLFEEESLDDLTDPAKPDDNNKVMIDLVNEVKKLTESQSAQTQQVIQLTTNQSKHSDKIVAQLMESRKNEGLNDYNQLNFEIQQIGNFTAKYPSNETEFYRWRWAIKVFQTTHSGFENTNILLFPKVIKNVTGTTRTAWNQSRNETWIAWLSDGDAENPREDDDVSRRKFAKTFDTIKNLTDFTLNRLQLRPEIRYFRRKFEAVRCFENESPKDTMTRLNGYIFQFNSLRKEMNPHLKLILRDFSDAEKCDFVRNTFVEENTCGSWLNNKVKTKTGDKLEELMQKHVKMNEDKEWKPVWEEITKYLLEKCTEAILSPLVALSAPEDRRWKKHESKISLFTLSTQSPNGKSPKHKKGTKRKFQRSTRYSADSEWANIPCASGAQCTYLKSGGCRYYHEPSHFTKKKFKPNPAKSKKQKKKKMPVCGYWDRGEKCAKSPCLFQHPPQGFGKRQHQKKKAFGRNKPTRPWKPPCNRGSACPEWQSGTCDYWHKAYEMNCAKCGKSGHGQSVCNSNATGSVPRYDLNDMNHPGPRGKHLMFAEDGGKDFTTRTMLWQQTEQRLAKLEAEQSVRMLAMGQTSQQSQQSTEKESGDKSLDKRIRKVVREMGLKK